MSRKRNEQGQYVEEITPETVRTVLETTNEPLTATEIGSELNISNRAALNKLNTLHERGTVGRKKVGASAVVWWSLAASENGGESA
jgi:predicted ArsR family transcriptional regulator